MRPCQAPTSPQMAPVDGDNATAADGGSGKCPICRCDLEEGGEPIYEWTHCRHPIHRECFAAIRRSELELRCPICRLDTNGIAP
eukprot:5458384-Lingulodinium_polyedra.AAC.1